MSDWSLKDLQDWDDRICEIAKKHNVTAKILGKTTKHQELTIDKIGNISLKRCFEINERWLPEYMKTA